MVYILLMTRMPINLEDVLHHATLDPEGEPHVVMLLKFRPTDFGGFWPFMPRTKVPY